MIYKANDIMKMSIVATAITNVGKIRTNNEDNYFLNGCYKNDSTVNNENIRISVQGGILAFAVCDGMGGEADGEIAALTAVKNLKICRSDNWKYRVGSNLNEINQLINEERIARKKSSMGTTFAGIYLDKNIAMACNVGDSRVYLLRKRKLMQISRDHNQKQSFLDMGIAIEQVMGHNHAGNELTQYLGMNEDDIKIEPYFSDVIRLRNGDRFLICSDGVTSMISDSLLQDMMSAKCDIGIVAKNIEVQALNSGGKDNITAVVVEVNATKTIKSLFKIAAIILLVCVIVGAIVFVTC